MASIPSRRVRCFCSRDGRHHRRPAQISSPFSTPPTSGLLGKPRRRQPRYDGIDGSRATRSCTRVVPRSADGGPSVPQASSTERVRLLYGHTCRFSEKGSTDRRLRREARYEARVRHQCRFQHRSAPVDDLASNGARSESRSGRRGARSGARGRFFRSTQWPTPTLDASDARALPRAGNGGGMAGAKRAAMPSPPMRSPCRRHPRRQGRSRRAASFGAPNSEKSNVPRAVEMGRLRNSRGAPLRHRPPCLDAGRSGSTYAKGRAPAELALDFDTTSGDWTIP